MAGKLVEVKDVYKSFGEQSVLAGVSLEVNETQNLVIFGKSGTGKSVLLKCMVGLLTPDKGTISINGIDVLNIPLKEMNELRKNIGFLFQGAALYDSMSVRENLAFPLIRNFNFTQKEVTQKVERALDMVSLSHAIDKMPSELSGGMRKRVGLARSIITEPMLMLYDEPTTGLDPITTKEISKLIRDLQQELKMTSIAVTHDLICAQIIADRVIVLNDGIILFEGDLATLTSLDDPFLKNFFSPEYLEDNYG
ncbi:MAG: ATP-binding cassette domain-containing protein [Ignavibacteriales bacterium]|jgi:phospholipid/cholesterol/gamma-HCH transport system ATP-binding protein|nr:ATP-binding cassette domain-containing protein [Ignavibacteriales bacterium]MBP7542360.1 ATP-binding cassette domain-containing protein [Ignavibacteriaceae bacterium]MBP9122186.1 ATP-binding cassette domain-containing protein [Ignavibacteriaceae bacterium]MCC6638704.1 ATP-binding cassette domain-containing protein [Ignavibacteriaceae bacterium]